MEVRYAGHKIMSLSTICNATSIVSNGSRSLHFILFMFLFDVARLIQTPAFNTVEHSYTVVHLKGVFVGYKSWKNDVV